MKTSYPDLVALTLTRLYVLEVSGLFDKLPQSLVQAFATDIVAVNQQTKDLVFICERYKQFAQAAPPVVSTEELNILPPVTYEKIQAFIQQRATNLHRLLRQVSKDGLGLMLQLILHSSKDSLNVYVLTDIARDAVKHGHSNLLPIFRQYGVLNVEPTAQSLEDTLAHQISQLTIVLNATDGSNHSEDETDSLEIDMNASPQIYAPTYEHALQVPSGPTLPTLPEQPDRTIKTTLSS